MRRSDGHHRPRGCAEISQSLVRHLHLLLGLFAFERKKFSRRSKEREANFGEVPEWRHSPGDRDVSVETRVLFTPPAQHGHIRQVEGLDALGEEPHATQEWLKQSDREGRPNNA